jgi:hypothetical protein
MIEGPRVDVALNVFRVDYVRSQSVHRRIENRKKIFYEEKNNNGKNELG